MSRERPDEDGGEARSPGPVGRAFGSLSRRKLLKAAAYTTVGAGVVAGGGLATLLALRGSAPPVEGLEVLDSQRFRTLSNLARVHAPPRGPEDPEHGAFDVDADEVGLARAFDAYLADEPADRVSDVETALDLVEMGPVLFDGRGATFSHLALDEQVAHWRTWGTSGLLTRRQVALAFRRFFYLVFYDRAEVWPFIGYPGPTHHGTP
ncbi:MAG: hypothetical protein ACQEXJ_18240 [Myxococcota bacterium]